MTKKLLSLVLLFSSCASLAVAPYISIRSQSENAAREIAGAGWNTQINLFDKCDFYSNVSITPEYIRSFRPCRIAECLFGGFGGCYDCDDCCRSSYSTVCNPCGSCNNNCNSCSNDCYRIGISGSQYDNRGSRDWLADYFGLPTDYKSCVTFKPQIDTFLVDFNMYLGLDEWLQGMYFRIHAPVVYTRWDLNMCECIESRGEYNHLPGYFDPTLEVVGTETVGILRENLVSDFTSFIRGCGTINDPDITFNPLCNAKMDCCHHKQAGLSDIQAALGWNFLLDECYHAGFNIRGAMPTGNRPYGEYLFEPIIGNGKHWELGVGFTGHWDFWTSCDECWCWSVFCDVNITHLFATRQCRTFDLKCKPLSRYMLAGYYGSPSRELVGSDGVTPPPTVLNNPVIPSKQLKGIYSPVANLTTMPVEVSSAAQADMVLMFQGVWNNNWSFDIGYNLWARSCEKIVPICDCFCGFEDGVWGLKGDAFMYGFFKGTPIDFRDGLALSATQSKATICKGRNTGNTAGDPWFQNSGIDNKKDAWWSELVDPIQNVTRLLTWDPYQGTASTANVYTSVEPVLLNFCDIDFNGARTKGLTHKLFANIDYTWCDCDCCWENWTPYLGVGFEVEFAHRNDCDDCCGKGYKPCGTGNICRPCASPCGCDYECCCSNDCCCNYCALNQWGIWLKMGAAFN